MSDTSTSSNVALPGVVIDDDIDVQFGEEEVLPGVAIDDEIERLGMQFGEEKFTTEEKAILQQFFAGHLDKAHIVWIVLDTIESDTSRLAYLKTFLKPESQGLYFPPENIITIFTEMKRQQSEMHQQLVEIIQKQEIRLQQLIEEKGIVSFSSIGSNEFQQFLNHTGFTIENVKFKENFGRDDSKPYKWSNYPKNHPEQQRKILEYLNAYLSPNLPADIMIYNVINNKELLGIHNNPIFPFDIRGGGGSDIILVERGYVTGQIIFAGIHATMVLKKAVQPNHVHQAILSMISADLFVNNEIIVFGVLTDLNRSWNIYWVEKEKKIKSITFSHRKKALDFITKMVSYKEGHMIDLPKIERVKVRQLFESGKGCC